MESWPVCGLTKPILMVPPEADPPDDAGEDAVLSELEQPASPQPAATPAAAPAATPRKPRLLSALSSPMPGHCRPGHPGGLALPGTSLDHPRIPPQARTTTEGGPESCPM